MANALEPFTGSDGDVSANWAIQNTEFSTSGKLQITSNQVTSVGGEYRQNVYSAFQPISPHYAQVKYVSGIANGVINLQVRSQSDPANGYQLQINGFDGNFYIHELNAGVETALTSGSSGTVNANDVFRLEVDSANNLVAKKNGTNLGTTSDATHSGGKGGMGLFMSGGTIICDDFEVGDLGGTPDFPTAVVPILPTVTAIGYATVTLVDPVYTGPGSITAESTFIGTPEGGDIIRYPTTDGLIVFADGTFSLNVNTGTYELFYDDGGGEDPFTVTVTNQTFTYGAFPTAVTTGIPAVYVAPSAASIPSEEAFGSPIIGLDLQTSSITSEEAFGTISFVAIFQDYGNIASEETFGTAFVSVLGVAPEGIPSEEAFGNHVLGDSILQSAGIASEEAFGTTFLDYLGIGLLTSIGPADLYGAPVIVGPLNFSSIDPADLYGVPRIGKIAIITATVEIVGDG